MTKHKRRPNGPPGETLEQWGYRTARETGYDAGNLRGITKRTWGITITDETAKRWADEARRTGMKLLTYTDKSKPWRTTAGHTITRSVVNGSTRYAIISPAWDCPITFTAKPRNAWAEIARIIGPFSLYIDGHFADDDEDTPQDGASPDLVSTPAEESEGEQLNAFDQFEGRMAA